MGTMLDCKKVQPQLSEYVDGALDGDTSWSIKLHLSSCAVCARVESDIRGTVRLLGGLPEMEPSESFEAKLAARLADQVLKPRRLSVWERVRDWWYDAPYARPMVTGVTSATVMAGVASMIFFVVVPHPTTSAGKGSTAPLPTVASNAEHASTLEQVWAEHASADPFGDDSSVLLAAQASPAADNGSGSGNTIAAPAADDTQVD